MAAQTTTDGNNRARRGGEQRARTRPAARRPSHDRRGLKARVARAAKSAPASTSTELVLYQPPEPEGPSLSARIADRASQLYFSASLAFRRNRTRPARSKTARIVVVVPAHNEQESIAATLEALLAQTRRPDRVVVVADNCTDHTVEIAKRFGRKVTVLETVGNADRKVGALTMAWREQVAGQYDYLLGVDADTVLAANSLADLEAELEAHPKIGGVMARYTFDADLGQTKWARVLIRMQRMEFSSWTLDMLHRKRNTYVLGGQATLFRVKALQEVTEAEKRFSPWDPDAQVEDMELTWALTARGWETKVSATARAYAGPMVTVKALWAQRRKWDEGMIRLLLGTKIGAATIYPWRMQLKMGMNAITRALFFLLLGTSLAVHAFVWNWIWILPPMLGALLNFKHARKIPGRTRLDLLLAGSLIGVELYLWFRLAVWTTSWATVIAGIRRDGWARQYKAEGLPTSHTPTTPGAPA